MSELARGDQVSHATFGTGVVESVRGSGATVRFAEGKSRTILLTHLTALPREERSLRSKDSRTLFDAYVMVDWSANSKPKGGADSVWYCVVEPVEGHAFAVNPQTRQLAVEELRSLLEELVDRGRRTLLGFDFPFGFPQGTGARLGLPDEQVWRSIWDELGLLVEDGPDNENNRFVAAGHLNGAMTMSPAPFWGCPKSQVGEFLSSTKPRPWPAGIEEFRRAEHAVAGPKSAWQLYGAGSVGSQALLGIPRLAALRDDAALEAVTRVWPFEVADAPSPGPPSDTPLVLMAEIYPSLVEPSPLEAIKDAGQVRALAEHFARLDDEGTLEARFDLSALADDSRAAVIAEEGWILGVDPA